MSGVNICGDDGIFIPTKASEGCECEKTVVEAGENVTVGKRGDGYTTTYTVNAKDAVVKAGDNVSVVATEDSGVTTYTVSSSDIMTLDEDGEEVFSILPDGKTYTVKQGNRIVFKINIAADMVVDGGSTITADGTEKKGTSDKAENAGLIAKQKYVRLHIANADTTKDYVYILATDLGVAYTAGDNITIKDGVISAVNTTYKAGTNVTISGNTISAKDTTYTAGEGITINGTTISAPLYASTNMTVTDAGSIGGYILTSKDTVTNIYTAISGKGTVPAVGILSNVTITGIPTGAKFLCTRCDSPYVIATNGWISNGTFYCTLVNYSNVARETTVECKYYITKETGV